MLLCDPPAVPNIDGIAIITVETAPPPTVLVAPVPFLDDPVVVQDAPFVASINAVFGVNAFDVGTAEAAAGIVLVVGEKVQRRFWRTAGRRV